MKRVVTSLTTGAVYKWGIEADFTGTFNPLIYQQVDLLDTAQFIAGLPKYYHKVDAGLLVEMSVAEKSVALVEWEAYWSALYNGSPQIKASFPTETDLPMPPGDRGYVVTVGNIGGTGRGLAMSTNTGWILFKQSGSV